MTYNLFGGTLNLTQSNPISAVVLQLFCRQHDVYFSVDFTHQIAVSSHYCTVWTLMIAESTQLSVLHLNINVLDVYVVMIMSSASSASSWYHHSVIIHRRTGTLYSEESDVLPSASSGSICGKHLEKNVIFCYFLKQLIEHTSECVNKFPIYCRCL